MFAQAILHLTIFTISSQKNFTKGNVALTSD